MGYSPKLGSPATATPSRLILPYLFPELSSFATAEDLIAHLRASDLRYRAALLAEFLDKNPPPMYITLYFVVTRLLDSLRVVRDHFLALPPTNLTVDNLETHLLAAESNIVAVGAARGTPCTPLFKGCAPSPLAPSHASAAAVDFLGDEEVGAASAPSGKRRRGKGRGGEGGSGGSRGGGGGSGGVGGSGGGSGGRSGGGGGGGGSGGDGGGSGSGGGGGSGGTGCGGGGGGGRGGAVQRGGSGGGQRQQQQCPPEPLTPQQLREWYAQRGASGGSARCPYVIRTGDRGVELPRWGDLLKHDIDIYALDFDAILAAMHALSVSGDGDCYLCIPPDPGIESAALGASESALSSTAPAEALYTFTLDSGASRCFFRDNTTLTPLTRPVAVSLADPSGGPVLARSSTVLPCPAVASGCLSGLHLPSFSTNLLRERFRTDLPVLRLHSDRGGEFFSDLLRDFCQGEGILQSFTLPASLQQNGVAERRIGLVMEVARTSMIHAVAPHFLWPFAVRYAAHQLNLLPRVSLPEISLTLRWMGEVGDASRFRVWGSRAFVRDTTADKLSARAIPCVILGFPTNAPGWQSYHPTSRRVFPSQDVTFDESVPFYRLFPYRMLLPCHRRSSSLQPVEVTGDSGAAGRGESECAEPGGVELVRTEPGGAEPTTAEPGGAEPASAEPGGAEPATAEPGGAEPANAEPGGAEPERAEPGSADSGGVAPWGTASPLREPLSPQQLREWYARRCRLQSDAAGAGGTGAGDAGAGGTGGAGALGPGGARIGDTRAAMAGGARCGDVDAGGAGAGGAGAGDLGGGDVGVGDAGAGGTGASGAGAGEHREPASRPASPVRTVRRARRVPRPRPPPVLSTHTMALRPSSVPQRVPLLSPPASSLPEIPDPESDRVRAASPTVTRLLATVVTDPSFESTATCALVAELVNFAAACRLDYAASLVAASESEAGFVCPPSVGGECALGTDILEDRQEDFECLAAVVPHLVAWLLAPEGDPDALDIPNPRSYAEAISGPYSSQWQTAMDAEMASWKSTGEKKKGVNRKKE
ncbi:unnamed protein product [Closterium sp. Yama58-4]|nr:unnamed protein product [Closterium sp. Yama58-4]